ncbi:GGDEF domain-containing protein [Chitinimonas koreensis]|uniref:GGDEF domain-containing protein n=1 Tax=Chitinimonas koreensis TaxID=356302 RepID=UPI000423B487|nr:sensor domain-containing diguanylate cyclase [Chitinimonas koreensis]QNM98143.1 diguanylate cyclase [Chitinimonas koreensis]
MLAEPALLLTALLDKLGTGVFVLDADQTIVLWNRWLEVASEHRAESVVGRRLTEVFPTLAGTRLVGAIEAVLQRGLPAVLSPALNPAPLDLRRPSFKDKARIRMQQSILLAPIRAGGRLYCLGQVQDVTAAVQKEDLLREQAEELRRLAYLDALTGIANRRQFDEALHEEWQQAARHGAGLGLLMVSADDFRRYNALFGHLRADQGLRLLADCLARQLPGLADLLARFDGKQFVLLLPQADQAGCQALADRLLAAVRALALPFPDARHGVLSVSIGVACLRPTADGDADRLLLLAERGLLLARQRGKDQWASETSGGVDR